MSQLQSLPLLLKRVWGNLSNRRKRQFILLLGLMLLVSFAEVANVGSVIPFFRDLAAKGKPLPITDLRMTRFWISIESATKFVMDSLEVMTGGELYVPIIPSMRIVDLANAISPNSKLEEIGLRPGEKLHEQMIGSEDALHTYEYADHYKILPAIHNWSQDPVRINSGQKVSSDFTYCSDNNTDWMNVASLQLWIKQNWEKIGNI